MKIKTRLRVAALKARDRKLAHQARRCHARTQALLEEIQAIRRMAEEQEVMDIGGAKRIEAELEQLLTLVPDLARLRNEVIHELNALTGTNYATFPETGA